MTANNSTFAGQLKHFALSVDIVDKGVFDQVRELVCKYVTNELKGQYFELLRQRVTEGDGNGEKQRSLETFWSSNDEESSHSWPLGATAGTYRNAVTAVAETARPIWLVSEDRSPLDAGQEHWDSWSDTKCAYPYKSLSGDKVQTAILIPLKLVNAYGVYCIESPEYFEATEVAKTELKRLGEALAILYGLWETNKLQSAHTGYAITDLRDMLDGSRFPRLALPHMFLAFSARADETVQHTIKEVLREYSGRLEFTDWSQIYESGNVGAQIGREIMESRFGACYFSEPVEGEGQTPQRYADNPNVVFEAGMLHARTLASADTERGEPAGWIPIRERESPDPPFDFAAERTLIVPRSQDGELNQSGLREQLRRRIDALLRDG